ncbi:MAG: acetyl CoA synthetase, partial [Thermoprotei archaeon]
MTSIYEKLKYLLRPETVAVIGAAREPHKIGHQVLKNLIEGGFSKNKIFPINPHAESILGLKCYPSVKNVPQPVDMAVIVVPARIVPRVLEDCVEKGVKAVAVISSGFKEIGKAEEEKKLVEIARKGGIRLLGPNIVGICDTVRSMNASFCQELPEKGDIAFITQSGALGIALIGWTKLKHIGLSDLVSIGNKADVDEVDLIEFFGEDPYTKVITLYLEGISRGREFYAIAKKVSKKKPIIILKAGKAERTISAIKSHTGSLAGSDVAYDAVFKQAGVIRAPTFPDLFDWAIAFSKLPLPSGENVVILTNGGGAGVMATDEAEIRGIKLMDIPPDLADKIREYMPPFGSVYNPIDLTGMATKDWYRGSLEVLLE